MKKVFFIENIRSEKEEPFEVSRARLSKMKHRLTDVLNYIAISERVMQNSTSFKDAHSLVAHEDENISCINTSNKLQLLYTEKSILSKEIENLHLIISDFIDNMVNNLRK